MQDAWEESTVLHRKKLRYPAIPCTIYYQKIKHALYDLGASVNLMSKAMLERLGYPAFSPILSKFNSLTPQSSIWWG
jgi:hypothetical protein